MHNARHRPRRLIGACGLGMLMLATACRASADERKIEVPGVQPGTVRSECDGDVAAEVRRAFARVDQRLAAYQDLKSTYLREKDALLSERTLFGFGPTAGSPDARKLAELATGIKFVANSSVRAMEHLAPFPAVDFTEGASKFGLKIYKNLKVGHSIYDAISDPLWEFTKGVAKRTAWGKILVGQIEIAEEIEASVQEFQAITQSHKDWASYAGELRAQIRRLDQGMLDAERRIAAARSQAESLALSEIARFCVERAKQVAQYASDTSAAAGDVAGSPYSEGSPYAAGALEKSLGGSALHSQRPETERRTIVTSALPTVIWNPPPPPARLARPFEVPPQYRPPAKPPNTYDPGGRPVRSCKAPPGSACGIQ